MLIEKLIHSGLQVSQNRFVLVFQIISFFVRDLIACVNFGV